MSVNKSNLFLTLVEKLGVKTFENKVKVSTIMFLFKEKKNRNKLNSSTPKRAKGPPSGKEEDGVCCDITWKRA